MMNLFLNPGFLAVAGALVSVPIIIHLINRMRFKRIRWAAMEFLLKAQKRKRKRLIIEQLLLLFLRCLLVALLGFLVTRFSSAFANFGSKPQLYVAVLDDTLSMREEWDEEGKGKARTKKTAFQVAIDDVLIKNVGQDMKSAPATDELVVLPVTRLVNETDFQPKYYRSLNDEGKFREFEEEMRKMEPTLQHVTFGAVAKKLAALVEARPNNRVTAFLLTDFRDPEWNAKAKPLQKELAELTKKHKDLYLKPLDVVRPVRDKNLVPESRGNVAIVDLRPATRVVSKTMRMEFNAKLANFGNQDQMVRVKVYDEMTGQERLDVNFRGAMPLKVPANSQDTIVSFDLPPFDERPDLPFKGSHVFISARLTDDRLGAIETDGLPTDNVRYTSVEVRENVPVLVVDGRGKSTKDLATQDWFYVDVSFKSAPAASYQVVFGEEIGRGVPARALERPEVLARFSAVYLLNVPDLTDEQVASLETYVAGGGGVAFFVGPEVQKAKDRFNKALYRDGKGVFPVKLVDVITAKLAEARDDGDGKKDLESQDLILRERLYPDLEKYPIFGKMLRDGMNLRNFENVNISKYFRVERPEVRLDEKVDKKDDKDEALPWDVKELATLPSEDVINFKVTGAIGTVFFGTNEDGSRMDESKVPFFRVLANDKFAKWRPGLASHRENVKAEMNKHLGKKVYHLARPLNYMLTDPGAKKIEKKDKEEIEVPDPAFPDMTELWSSSDPDVKALRQQILNLYDQFAYGDPFIFASRYGRGRVVTVLSTVGQRWSGWAVGGSPDNPSAFPIFLEELQKYLASQGSEATYTVGMDMKLQLEQDVFKKRGIAEKVKRVFMKAAPGKSAEVVFRDEILGREKAGMVTFNLPSVQEPGMSVTELYDDRTKELVTSVVHVFNVDAMSEGPLERVASFDVLRKESREGSVEVLTSGVNPGQVVAQQSVVSELPLFFLLLICVLIAEQALAVHLSFHMKSDELALPRQAGPAARAA